MRQVFTTDLGNSLLRSLTVVTRVFLAGQYLAICPDSDPRDNKPATISTCPPDSSDSGFTLFEPNNLCGPIYHGSPGRCGNRINAE